MLILLVAIIIDNDKEKGAVNIALFTILILAMTPLKDVANITINAGVYNRNMNKEISSVVEETNNLKKIVPNNTPIYIVNQQLEDNKFKYYMLPENDVTMGVYFGNNRAKNEKEQFKEVLYKYYDYVYIRANDDYFTKNYGELFNGEIEEKQVYRVIKDNEKNIKLERIDSNE